jgi:hypothetical protein
MRRLCANADSSRPDPEPPSSAAWEGRLPSNISGAACANTGPVATGSVGTEAGRNGKGIDVPAPEEAAPGGASTPTEGLTTRRASSSWLTRTLRLAAPPPWGHEATKRGGLLDGQGVGAEDPRPIPNHPQCGRARRAGRRTSFGDSPRRDLDLGVELGSVDGSSSAHSSFANPGQSFASTRTGRFAPKPRPELSDAASRAGHRVLLHQGW